MFSFGSRDIPDVENKILSYLGPRDLARAELVSQEWHAGVARYITHLKKVGKWNSLHNKAFLEPVTSLAKMSLHKRVADIAVNANGDVYFLTDDSILQYDVANMRLKTELPFPTAHAEHWQKFAQKGGSKELFVSEDGQRFTMMIQDETRLSRSDLLWAGRGRLTDILTFRRDPSGAALQWSSCGGPLSAKSSLSFGYLAGLHGNEDVLQTIRSFAEPHLTDIVWLQGKSAAIFSVASRSGKRKSKVYGVDAAGAPSLLARVSMSSAKLHVVGTRVICQETSSALENQGEDAIMIFDVWRPESVGQGGDAFVTEMNNAKQMNMTTENHNSWVLQDGCRSPPRTMSRGL